MKTKQVDYKFFFAWLFLVVFWMIMISSVSVFSSFRVTDSMFEKWLISESYNYFYVIRNIIHVAISLILLWIITKIPYKFFYKNAKNIFVIILVLLVFVLVKWATYKWASWWISIPWVPFNIQPTEFLKISLILFLAYFFKINKNHLHKFKKWFIPFLWIIGLVVALVWLQPDFWTLMVILPVSVIMFFLAWANIKHLLVMWLLWIVLIGWVYSAWDYDKQTWKNLNTLWYITQRIDNFLADNETAIKNKSINYQTEQGLIAIWSWWVGGLWFWKSIQKFWYLPEVQGDFIFSVIIEELGFVWGFILISIYLFLWFRWFYIASKVDDLFWKYSAFWISSWILIQAFINIWVNLNIVPLTWITLPFISYGGSSLLSLAIAVWILLSISRDMQEDSKYSRLIRKKMFNLKF